MIQCRHCGHYNLRIEIKKFAGGEHHQAICEGCGKFSHNVPHQPPSFYFGKYKGKKVSEVQDLPYLQWFIEKTNPSKSMREAVAERISKIEYNTK